MKQWPIDTSELRIKPIEKAETIPANWYTSKEIFELEYKQLFPGCWQLGCHESQVSRPGDFHTFEVAGNPIMVVRDQEKQLNTFYNVCRHRGGPLAVKKGTTSMLQCQYHGWTYRLDGSLRGVPQFDRVDLFDKKDFGLIPVSNRQWMGLVFVNLSEQPGEFERFVAGIEERISPANLSTYEFHSEKSYHINCNWKVYIDNYLEGYHLPIVHPELAKLLDYREYVTETGEWHSIQYSPLKQEENFYGGSDSYAYYVYLFPNIMLNILPGRLQTNIVRPISAEKTEVVFSYYYTDTDTPRSNDIRKRDRAYSHKIQLEDIEICESVQKGLQSRAYNKGRFSVDREQGVYHFQSLLKRTYREILEKN